MNQPKFSSNVITSQKKGVIIFRYLLIINIIITSWYLQWRITHSINLQALWLAIPFLLAEIYFYVGGMLFFLGMWKRIVRKVTSFNQMTPSFPQQFWPVVDVFITCDNEPLEIVKKTVLAALKIDYPQTKLFVYLLDDGNSPTLRKMIEKIGKLDLENPQIQGEANRINAEINQLEKKLKELDIYLAELENNRQFIPDFSLEVETKSEDFNQVFSWLDTLKQPYISNDDWYKFKLALGEGFDNVIKYGHRYLSQKTPIKIEVNILSDYLVFRIWDQGDEFDLEKYLRQMPNQVDEMAEGGRGFLIFQEIADYFSYTHYPKQGNCLLMIQKYSPISERNYALSYSQSLQEIILLLNSEYRNIQDYLLVEKAKIEAKIAEQEFKLTQLIRCRYISREKITGKPHYGKAGNINHAIFSGLTFGDFILTLDADYIPKSEILQRVLPYFYKYDLNTGNYQPNRVAFVQTPRVFSNIPAADPFNQKSSLFSTPISQGKDGLGFAFYTGTNAVLKRKAIVNIGAEYFTQYSQKNNSISHQFDLVNNITEDLYTTIRLHAAGWQSVYHCENLSFGLAPHNLRTILQEKLHGNQGLIQVWLKQKPWLKTDLNFGQQLQYFLNIYSYFSGFFVLILLICPLIFFYNGIIPVQSYNSDFLIHFLPAFIFNRLTLILANWGIPAKLLWQNEQWFWSLFPLNIQTVLTFFTGKSSQIKNKKDQGGNNLSLIWIQISFIILGMGGIIVSIYRGLKGNLEQPQSYIINVGWLMYNITLLLGIIRAAFWQSKSS